MKSQSSLEFASTYGWAIIIIAMVITTLLIYTNKETNYDITCDLGPQFICNEVSLDSYGHLNIEFVNNINEEILLTQVNFSNLLVNCPALPIIVKKGNKGIIQCKINKSYSEQNKENLNVNMVFTLKDSSEEYVTRGKIVTRINSLNEEFIIDCDEDNDGYDKYNCGLSNDCDDEDNTKWHSECFNNLDCGIDSWVCNNPSSCEAQCENLCDKDGDNHLSIGSCGGNDCDDNNNLVWKAECYSDANCPTGYECSTIGSCNSGCTIIKNPFINR